jgi:hypothetical protein
MSDQLTHLLLTRTEVPHFTPLRTGSRYLARALCLL